MDKKAYAIPEPGISDPVTFNSEICNGCNRCMEVCQVDIFIPNPERGKPPIVLYPGECWYCGCCVSECPKSGAIKLNPKLMNRVHWKSKIN
ncbi:MAG: ferredoxin family protein [Candidatus Odinarchaeota archaeon]